MMPGVSSLADARNPLKVFSTIKAVMPRVRLGAHHQRIGVRAVGDPHLCAVQIVVVAL